MNLGLLTIPMICGCAAHYQGRNDTLIGGALVGVADGLPEENLAIGFISYTQAVDSHLISFRVVDAKETLFDAGGDVEIYSAPSRHFGSTGGDWRFSDVGVLYGRGSRGAYGSSSVSVGVGVAGIRRSFRETGDTAFRLTPAIPVEARVLYALSPSFGIGFYGFGNFNTKQSFGGAVVGLHVGKLR